MNNPQMMTPPADVTGGAEKQNVLSPLASSVNYLAASNEGQAFQATDGQRQHVSPQGNRAADVAPLTEPRKESRYHGLSRSKREAAREFEAFAKSQAVHAPVASNEGQAFQAEEAGLREHVLAAHGPIHVPLCMGVKVTHTRDEPHELSQWFINPVVKPSNKPKADAAYILRSVELAGVRSGAQANGGFVLLAWDIDKGNQSVTRIEELSRKFWGNNIGMLFTTASAMPDDMRWRILVPTAQALSLEQWVETQQAFDLFLTANNVETDDTARSPKQLVGLPNVPEKILNPDGTVRADGRYPAGTYDPITGQDLSGTPIVFEYRVWGVSLYAEDSASDICRRWLEQARTEQAEGIAASHAASVERAIKREAMLASPGLDAIGAFNATHDIEDVLLECGYEQSPYDPTCWRSPLQTTGSYATKVFPDGRWVSLSGSDAAAGVGNESKGGNRSGDAFDIHAHFRKGGNFKLAVAELHSKVDLSMFSSSIPAPFQKKKDKLAGFEYSGDGKGVDVSRTNLEKALLKEDLCHRFAFDDFLCETMVREAGVAEWRPIKDTDFHNVAVCLEQNGFKRINKDTLRDTVMAVAERQRFDSGKQWLEVLSWDGVSRCRDLLVKGFGAEPSAYHTAVSLYTMTALAGRVLSPGVKADMVPIAVGAQGCRKSTAVAALAPKADFFTELDLSAKDEDMYRLMKGIMVAELGELSGMRKTEAEALKRLVTQTTNTWIEKWQTAKTVYQRRCIFFGTSNRDDFLSDPTGSRRWLPFKAGVTGLCDPEWIAQNLNQLCAEAAQMFKTNGVAYSEAERLAKLVHSDYVDTDVWEELIETWLDTAGFGGVPNSGYTPRQGFIQTRDVLSGAIGMIPTQMNHAATMRVGKALVRLGFERVQRRVDGRPRWGYIWPRLDMATG